MSFRSLLLPLVTSLVLALGSIGAAPASADSLAAGRDYWPTADWRVAQPAEHGLDASLLQIADGRFQAEWPLLSSVVVVHGGEIVFEGNYGGYEPDRTLDIWSATKSFTSAAVGIAINDGLLSLSDTVGELMPERVPAGVDPLVYDVTVRDLLTMTGGWEWASNTDYANVANAEDWAARTLGLPLVNVPGTTFTYNSGGSHLLSVIVQEVTGMPMADYLQTELFDPLGIQPSSWDETPQGETSGAVGLHITARDMARFGYLYLNGGVWDGKQIVPEGWVEASTKSQMIPGPGTNLGNALGYGYQWWIDEAAGYESYFALGYGEQVIYVVPDLDLVIVGAVAEDIPVEALQFPRAIFEELIVPAAIGAG